MSVVNFRNIFKSITTENGREFYDYKSIEESFTENSIKRTELYYCDTCFIWLCAVTKTINDLLEGFCRSGLVLKV